MYDYNGKFIGLKKIDNFSALDLQEVVSENIKRCVETLQRLTMNTRMTVK